MQKARKEGRAEESKTGSEQRKEVINDEGIKKETVEDMQINKR